LIPLFIYDTLADGPSVETPAGCGPESEGSPGRRPEPGNRIADPDAALRRFTRGTGWVLSSPPPLPLFTGQDEKLGVSRQHLADRVLEFAPRCDALADLLRPVPRDALDVPLALHHEGERPSLVTSPLGATATGMAASRVTARQGAGEQIAGKRKTPQQLKLPLPQPCGLSPPNVSIHIVVMILQVKPKMQAFFECENRTGLSSGVIAGSKGLLTTPNQLRPTQCSETAGPRWEPNHVPVQCLTTLNQRDGPQRSNDDVYNGPQYQQLVHWLLGISHV